jgi:hypothetical protein
MTNEDYFLVLFQIVCLLMFDFNQRRAEIRFVSCTSHLQMPKMRSAVDGKRRSERAALVLPQQLRQLGDRRDPPRDYPGPAPGHGAPRLNWR